MMVDFAYVLYDSVSFGLVLFAVAALTHRSRTLTVVLMVVYPALLLPLIAQTEWSGWFNVFKVGTMLFCGVYLALARYLRHPGFHKAIYWLFVLNILEAVIRDFEIGHHLNALTGLFVIALAPRPSTFGLDEDYRIVGGFDWPYIVAYSAWHTVFVLGYASIRGCVGDYVLINSIVLAVPLFMASKHGRQFWLQFRAVTLTMQLVMMESTIDARPSTWPRLGETLDDERLYAVAAVMAFACTCFAGRSAYRGRKSRSQPAGSAIATRVSPSSPSRSSGRPS